jgi:hypothetical protein
LVTGVPVVMDTTQGGTAPGALQRGRAPLVTVWPAASTNGTVDAKHVVPTRSGREVVYDRVTVKVPVKPVSVNAAAGQTRSSQFAIWNGPTKSFTAAGVDGLVGPCTLSRLTLLAPLSDSVQDVFPRVHRVSFRVPDAVAEPKLASLSVTEATNVAADA